MCDLSSTSLSKILFKQIFGKYRAKCGKQHMQFLVCSASCRCPILTKQGYVITLLFNFTSIPSVFCHMPAEHRMDTADALHSRMHAHTHQHAVRHEAAQSISPAYLHRLPVRSAPLAFRTAVPVHSPAEAPLYVNCAAL